MRVRKRPLLLYRRPHIPTVIPPSLATSKVMGMYIYVGRLRSTCNLNEKCGLPLGFLDYDIDISNMRGFISAPLLAATALSSSLKARADTEYQVTDFSAYIAAHTSSQT